LKLKESLVILDLETTGTWIDKDKIIEIAMIKCFPDGRQQETYHQKVNPGIPIPAIVTQLTGIKDKDVEKEPKFQDIAKEVLDFLRGSDLGGFNIERFDLPLLEREFQEAGHLFNWRLGHVYDAQVVFHTNVRRDLTAAYELYCGKSLTDAHTAMADTQATLEILAAQVKQYGEGEESIEALKAFQYRPSQDFYDGERKFRWWNGKLYMMFGKYARKQSLQEIVKMDKGYLEWILSADFSEEVKTLVSNALQGRFPVLNPKAQKELFDQFVEES